MIFDPHLSNGNVIIMVWPLHIIISFFSCHRFMLINLIGFDGSPKFNRLYFLIFCKDLFSHFKYLFFDSYCLPLS